MTPPPIVYDVDIKRRNNAQLMRDVVQLGYINLESDVVLDCTYGKGAFWRLVRPLGLVATDIDPELSPASPADFRALPYPAGLFDVTVIDGPYQYNGTSTGVGPSAKDESYAVHKSATPEERDSLIMEGITECIRVTRVGGFVMVKCQDQVVSKKKRWQSQIFTDHATARGCRLADKLHVYGTRKQPFDGTDKQRRQWNSRTYISTLLILRKT